MRQYISRRIGLLIVTLVLALGVPFGMTLGSHQFGDVPNSNMFHADIDALVDSGVTFGCGNGNYCPKSVVTREQMAAFLNRLGALAPGKTPVVNAAKLDGLDSSAFSRPMYAVVNADGTLVRGAAVLSTSRIGVQVGRYEVVFNRSVTSCAYTASIGDPSAGVATPGFITVASRAGVSAGVFIETQSVANSDADLPFQLHVSCVPGSGTVTFEAAPAGSSASQDE